MAGTYDIRTTITYGTAVREITIQGIDAPKFYRALTDEELPPTDDEVAQKVADELVRQYSGVLTNQIRSETDPAYFGDIEQQVDDMIEVTGEEPTP